MFAGFENFTKENPYYIVSPQIAKTNPSFSPSNNFPGHRMILEALSEKITNTNVSNQLKKTLKHFLLKVISNQINDRDISFLRKIRLMLEKKQYAEDNTDEE